MTTQRFHVIARPLFPGSTVITYDVCDRLNCTPDGQERIVQSSPKRAIAERVAAYHNQHYSELEK